MARIKLVFTLSSVSLLLAAVTWSALPERDPFAGLEERGGAERSAGSSRARRTSGALSPDRTGSLPRDGATTRALRARDGHDSFVLAGPVDSGNEGKSVPGLEAGAALDAPETLAQGAQTVSTAPAARTHGVLSRVLALVLPPRSESVRTVPLAAGEGSSDDDATKAEWGFEVADPSRTVAILAKVDRSRRGSARAAASESTDAGGAQASVDGWYPDPPEGWDADWYAPAPEETAASRVQAPPDGTVALTPLRPSPRRGAGDDLSWYDSLGAPVDGGAAPSDGAPADGLLDALLAYDRGASGAGTRRAAARRPPAPAANGRGASRGASSEVATAEIATGSGSWIPATPASFTRFRLVKLVPTRDRTPAPRTNAAPAAVPPISLPLPEEERTPAITVASLGPALPGRGATSYLGLAEPRPEPTPKPGFCPLGSVEKRTKSERWCARKDKGGVAFREGPVAFLYPNGKKRAVGTYAGGRLHGDYTEYAENGRRIGHGSYKNGKRTGTWTFWWPNGKKQSKGAFVRGERTGVWTYYDERGRKSSHGELRTIARVEKKQGRWTFWHANGKKAEEGVFRAGRKDGAWKRFDESGRLVSTVRYHDGEEEF